MKISRTDIQTAVARTIEGSPQSETIDVPAIVDEIIGRFGFVDIETIPPGMYWDIVRRRDSTQQPWDPYDSPDGEGYTRPTRGTSHGHRP